MKRKGDLMAAGHYQRLIEDYFDAEDGGTADSSGGRGGELTPEQHATAREECGDTGGITATHDTGHKALCRCCALPPLLWQAKKHVGQHAARSSKWL
jgi:hypothetical protein